MPGLAGITMARRSGAAPSQFHGHADPYDPAAGGRFLGLNVGRRPDAPRVTGLGRMMEGVPVGGEPSVEVPSARRQPSLREDVNFDEIAPLPEPERGEPTVETPTRSPGEPTVEVPRQRGEPRLPTPIGEINLMGRTSQAPLPLGANYFADAAARGFGGLVPEARPGVGDRSIATGPNEATLIGGNLSRDPVWNTGREQWERITPTGEVAAVTPVAGNVSGAAIPSSGAWIYGGTDAPVGSIVGKTADGRTIYQGPNGERRVSDAPGGGTGSAPTASTFGRNRPSWGDWRSMGYDPVSPAEATNIADPDERYIMAGETSKYPSARRAGIRPENWEASLAANAALQGGGGGGWHAVARQVYGKPRAGDSAIIANIKAANARAAARRGG